MPRAIRHAVILVCTGLLLGSGQVAAAVSISPTAWQVTPGYTNVPPPSYHYEHATPSPRPTPDGGYRFGVRMPRVASNQPPAGRAARLGISVRFTAVEADEMTVEYWVRNGTPPADPPGSIVLYAHCSEDGKWARLGHRVIDRERQDRLQAGKQAITDDDCAGRIVDGMMLVIRGADDEDDHRWRTVFLSESTLKLGPTTILRTDFTQAS